MRPRAPLRTRLQAGLLYGVRTLLFVLTAGIVIAGPLACAVYLLALPAFPLSFALAQGSLERPGVALAAGLAIEQPAADEDGAPAGLVAGSVDAARAQPAAPPTGTAIPAVAPRAEGWARGDGERGWLIALDVDERPLHLSADPAARGPAAARSLGARRAAITPLRYTVAEGDTLVKIAERFHITPETVMWANDLGNGALLQPGQELTILPISGVLHRVEAGDTVSAVASMYGANPQHILDANLLSEDEELVEGWVLVVPGGMLRTTEPITGLPEAPSGADLAEAPRYTVRPNDTLVSIADAFGVRPSVIQVANDLLDPDLLQIGQELVIPGGTPPAEPAPGAEAPAPEAEPAAPDAAPEPPDPVSTPEPATPDQAEVVAEAPPTQATAEPPAPSPASEGEGVTVVYLVNPGDTLYSIARAHGVSVGLLQEANGLEDPNQLRAGQRLSIPGGRTPIGTLGPATEPAPSPDAPAPTPVPEPSPTPAPTEVAPPEEPVATPEPAPEPVEAPPAYGSRGDQIAAIAQNYLGYRYVWGGHSPEGFDCSGFVWYVYREAGVSIPLHDLAGQLNAGPRVEPDALLPGDLLFWNDTYAPGLSHVGIYLGDGRFINAETEVVGVQVRSISDPYWSTRFAGASRPW